MKTNAKRLFSLLLAVLMVFGCASTAFAADAKTVKQYGKVTNGDDSYYGGVTILGDSVSRGCGAGYTPDMADDEEAYWAYMVNDYYKVSRRAVDKSYALQLAEAVGCEIKDEITKNESGVVTKGTYMQDAENNSYWPICSPGQTLAMTLRWLGLSDNGAADAMQFTEAYNATYEKTEMIPLYFTAAEDGWTPAKEAISHSSLIVLELGMCDVINYSTVALSEDLTQMIDAVKEGFNYWSTYYPVLMKYVKEMNPNADVVLVGCYNPLYGITLSDESVLPLGNILSLIPDLMNQKLKQWAKQYGFTYVDIFNTEIGAEAYDSEDITSFFENILINNHPSPEGYAYISRQILDALPREDGADCKYFTTMLNVDLGGVKNVTSVAVNNIPKLCSTYSYNEETHILKVFNLCPLANSLTVNYTTENGTKGSVTYKLTLGRDGYSAHRIFSTKDLSKTITGILNMPSKIFDLIKNLFGSLKTFGT